ncbi:MAG: TrmH family RNA methyltransferase [Myxococcales bacterium]
MSPNVRIVLVRPAEPMNVGGVARAMKNCELDDLVLVEPRTDDWVTARRIAVHAEELLAQPQVVGSIAEAVADCVWVVGTSSREIPGRERIAPRQVGERCAQVEGRVALVFGGEESGLSNDDLVRCHALSCIPGGREQPSYNLAQAVLVYAYECLVARTSSAPPPPTDARTSPQPPPASGGGARGVPERELQLIEDATRQLLVASGFADPDRPRHGVLDLLQPLRRAGMTADEAKLWHAALRTVLRKARGAKE